MLPTLQTIGRYTYTLGVLFTGAFLGEQVGGFDSISLWFTLFVAAALWVVYYVRVMVPRFEQFSERNEDDRTEERPPPEV